MDVGRLQWGSIYMEETHWLVCQRSADLASSSAEVHTPKNKPGWNPVKASSENHAERADRIMARAQPTCGHSSENTRIENTHLMR